MTLPERSTSPTVESQAPAPPLLQGRNLCKAFGQGPGAVQALDGVDIDVPAGRLVAVRGRSGSGKTTLLNLCGGLERPDSGDVTLTVPGHGPIGLASASEAGLLDLRRRFLGYIFQSFGLLPMLTAAENVGVPLRLSDVPVDKRESRVAELLERVGLTRHSAQRPEELSGGQQQRVAVARALAGRPRLLIADEPTGQLDTATGTSIMQLLREVVDTEGVALLVATHEPALTALADTVVELHDGRTTA